MPEVAAVLAEMGQTLLLPEAATVEVAGRTISLEPRSITQEAEVAEQTTTQAAVENHRPVGQAAVALVLTGPKLPP